MHSFTDHDLMYPLVASVATPSYTTEYQINDNQRNLRKNNVFSKNDVFNKKYSFYQNHQFNTGFMS
jgi:hypothetical protein